MPRKSFGKSDEAGILLEAFHQAKTERVRATYVHMLDNIWPGVRCTYEDGRIRVFYASSQMKAAPGTLLFAASYVEAVREDGSAQVVKDEELGPHDLKEATFPLDELQAETLPRPAPTVWARLLRNDDI